MIARTLLLSLLFFPAAFASAEYLDVKSEHTFFDSATYWTEQGVTEGYPGEAGNRHFKAYLTVNRAETVKMVIGAMGVDIGGGAPSGFPDVPAGVWYEPYLSAAKARGLIQGYPDGTFKGEQLVTFAELAKIVSVGMGYAPTGASDPWYREYLDHLGERNAIPTTVVSLSAPALRGELAETLYRLKAGRTDKSSLAVDAVEQSTRTAASAPTGGPTESALLVDSFDDATMDGWTVVDAGSTDVPSMWTVRKISEIPNGMRRTFATPRLVQFENTYNGDPSLVVGREGTYVLWNDIKARSWNNYKFSVTINSLDDDGIGVLFRYRDAVDYEKLGFDRQRNFAKIFKVSKGVERVIAETPFEYPLGEDFRVTVTVNGNTIMADADGQSLFGTVMDPSPTSGTVGLMSWGNMGVAFEEVSVVQQ